MSDNEYYSDSDNSEKEDSDNEDTHISLNKKPLFKPSIQIQTSNENDMDDSEVDDADDVLEEVDDDGQIGGISDFPDDDDDVEEVNDNDDEDSDVEMNKDDENSPPSKNEESKNNKHNKSQKGPIYNEEEEEDDEYDENYLQKFDNEIMKNYVNDFHPECLNHNYDEIAKLSVVVKNSDGIIIDPLHRTIPYLTKYERARVLGQRAKQIETGAKPFVKVPENIVDSYIIAELELKEKKIPFIIRRPVPGGGCEYWNIKDLEQIAF